MFSVWPFPSTVSTSRILKMPSHNEFSNRNIERAPNINFKGVGRMRIYATNLTYFWACSIIWTCEHLFRTLNISILFITFQYHPCSIYNVKVWIGSTAWSSRTCNMSQVYFCLMKHESNKFLVQWKTSKIGKFGLIVFKKWT